MLMIEIQGLDALTRAVQQLATQAREAMIQAVQAEAERILDAARLLTPIDTGLLVSTGMVETNLDGASIRFGGHGLAGYSIVVHEDVTMNHPNGGQHHFLSEPFFAATGEMPARLAADVAPRLRG